KLARRLMTIKRYEPDAVAFGCVPLPVEPWSSNHKVFVFRVVLAGVGKNLPRPPWILLVPKARDVQEWNRRRVQLADPCFLLPELVVVRVSDDVVPVGDRAMQVLLVDVRERAKGEIPRIGVVSFEDKICIFILISLLKDGIFKSIALAQRSVVMIVVVHPLINRRGLLADGFEGRVGLQKSQRTCQ